MGKPYESNCVKPTERGSNFAETLPTEAETIAMVATALMRFFMAFSFELAASVIAYMGRDAAQPEM